MAKEVKLTYTKTLLDFFESENAYDNCTMLIPQFSLLKNRNGGDINLVIGYGKHKSGNTHKYIVIKERGIRDGVLDAHPINKDGLENPNYYCRIPRTSVDRLSIFSTDIRKGDWVMCVAKNRYKGVQFGESLEVMGVTDESRLQFYGTDYTYDPKFFVVIDRSGGFLVKPVNGTTSQSISKSSGDNYVPKVLEKEGELPLMRRKRLDGDIQRIRPIYDPEKISRIK